MQQPQRVAIVIEPDLLLAGALRDAISAWNFQVVTFVTHRAAAAAALVIDRIDILMATVPASDDDRPGAYLAEAASTQEAQMAVVVMLRDPIADRQGVPAHAVELMKPFTVLQLKEAISRAESAAAISVVHKGSDR